MSETRNLNKAEDRIRDLENAFQVLLPHVDLEAFLISVKQDPPNASNSQPQETSITFQEELLTPRPIPADTGQSNESDSEALPQEADGFDWSENAVSLNDLSDGMAALSIRPEGAGYLGATSSVVPLRALLSHGQNAVGNPGSPNGRSDPQMFSNSILSTMNPSDISQNTFIDAYFQFYHTQYPFVHEGTFRAQYNGNSPRPKGQSWPILLNTILAIGAWSIGDDDSTIDDVFYNEVSRLCMDSSVFESGNLALVQALLLLSNYTQKRNRPNTGWNYLGLAVRTGLSLGLHKEFPKWEITLLQREIRRRVWWGIYIFDSGASITFGRPILLPELGIMDACEVMNIPEESLTTTTDSLPGEIEEPTIYSSLIAQSKFHYTVKGLYNRLISHPEPTAQELLDLEKPINTWEESIPSYFQTDSPGVQSNNSLLLARYRLHWRSWNVRIVLFRPVILRWAAKPWKSNNNAFSETQDEIMCRQRCLENARLTINSISDYMLNNISSRLGTWYMLYFLFQAGLIPIIYLMTDPTNSDAPSWLDDIRATKNLLTYTSAYNQLAARCLEIVDRLCSPVLNDPEPEVMLQSSEIFDEAHAMYLGEQFGTMEFWDWSNNVLQGSTGM
ncbi:C6 transcription factor [Phlyctema vagabunda]|uniref:C6 transcription factor n=1 Tax=Phlyctema vagabunda TaxID=108571 RepID=A0ABR4P4S3_9HELO